MKSRNNSEKFTLLLIVLILLVFVGFGCENPTNPTDPTQGTTTGSGDPTATGEFTKCTYKNGLADIGYRNAIIYYPCETNAGPFPASTLTGGYTNTKEEMDWVGSHVVTHGYIVIAMTPNNNMGTNASWRSAHNAGLAKLKSENNRAGSPITGMVDTNALQIMGFSKGGGGTLLAAHDQGAAVKSAQALAPYMDNPIYNIKNIKAATIVYTGTGDMVAPAIGAVGMFNALPRSIDRSLAYFRGMPHTGWMLNGSAQDHMKALTYITAWMKVYLSGDMSYAGYIDGNQNWFLRFQHFDANQGTGADLLPSGCGQ